MPRFHMSNVLVVAAAAALATPPAAATIFYQQTIAANGGGVAFNAYLVPSKTPSGFSYMHVSGGVMQTASWRSTTIAREFYWIRDGRDDPLLWWSDKYLDFGCSVGPGVSACYDSFYEYGIPGSVSMTLNQASARVNYNRPTGYDNCHPFNGVYWRQCGVDFREDPMYFSVEAFGPGDITLTITDTYMPGAVPEPASWALLVAGFGLTGAALRRRRAQAATRARAA